MTRKSTYWNGNFPIDSVLSLSPLIKYWEDNLENNPLYSGFKDGEWAKKLRDAAELKLPIKNNKILYKHQELIQFLMMAIFPPALEATELSAAVVPFSFRSIYATPDFLKIIPYERLRNDIIVSVGGTDINAARILMACIFILNKFHHTDLTLNRPILATLHDEQTGLPKIFKVNLNTQFVEVIHKNGKPEPIGRSILRKLLDDMYNTELWLRHIKLTDYQFQGFGIYKLVDVTVEEMLSSIKYDLLEKDALTCSESFQTIQEKMSAIFKIPGLKLGISYFDPNNNIISNYDSSDWHSFMMPSGKDSLHCKCFSGSVYQSVCKDHKPVIIEDLKDYPDKSMVERDLLKKGFRNIMVAPLIYDHEIIGVIELGCTEPGMINGLNTVNMENILPMITAAVRRILGEMRTEVRAVIQEEYTTIHPSVDWKFLEKGYELLNNRRKGIKAELGPVVFNNVYPIYGLSDIRNSSLERAKAIQLDLLDTLEPARKVVSTISMYRSMPILDELNFRVTQNIEKISSGLDTGDESAIMAFLREEVTPAINYFKDTDKLLSPVIEDYEKLLDPKFGVIYNKRKNFERSVTRINEAISAYIDQQEELGQEVLPHYFEKFKTDGVEYNAYVGESLMKDKIFSYLHLENFRLWQLQMQCEIAVRIEKLKHSLPKKLEIAQLILVHGEPLSIKFRNDEKRFDVDGSYNIRYEIVKKRIDKALIKDTHDRLTQPGKIAIVFSRQKEALEYLRYINYLRSIHYLTDNVEHLELEELQGVNGLHALRVEVNLKANKVEPANEMLTEVIAAVNA